jgi:ribonuclease P protein component
MAAPCSPAVAPVDDTSSPSATRLSFIPDHEGPNREGPNREDSHPERPRRFPKEARLLRSSDFRTIYDTGKRYTCAHFAAFYLMQAAHPGSPRVGFTTPRALGRAHIRNRVKRRFREAVRLHLAELTSPWSVVINPRRSSLALPFPALEGEIQKLFWRLSSLTPPGSLPGSSAYIK